MEVDNSNLLAIIEVSLSIFLRYFKVQIKDLREELLTPPLASVRRLLCWLLVVQLSTSL